MYDSKTHNNRNMMFSIEQKHLPTCGRSFPSSRPSIRPSGRRAAAVFWPRELAQIMFMFDLKQIICAWFES
jgi:hypothetical protein